MGLWGPIVHMEMGSVKVSPCAQYIVGAQLPGAPHIITVAGGGGVCKGLAGRSQGRREQQWRPGEELFLGVGDTWCGEVLSRIRSAALSVQGPSGASALGTGRPTPQGCLETSRLPWPAGSQRALQNSLGGSGWLSSAGCVMTRPGFAVLTARSSSSDWSLSSTEIRLRVCRWHPGCCRTAHR